MKSLLTAHSLALYFEDHRLWQISHLNLNFGDKIGLVGRNGSGKSLLLRVLAGENFEQAGEVRQWGSIFYLAQEMDLLPFKSGLWLSPGQAQRQRLEQAFDRGSDLLLLDEPTNHLDTKSREWFLNKLQFYPGACLVASHDRWLLSKMDQIWHLDRQIQAYSGGFAFYEKQRALEAEARKRQYDTLRFELRRREKTRREVLERQDRRQAKGKRDVEKLGLPRIVAGAMQRKAQNTKAKLKSVHEGNVENLREQKEQAYRRLDLEFEIHWPFVAQRSRSELLIQATELQVGFNKDLWPSSLHFLISRGDRVQIEGGNGCGKSTLLRAIVGETTLIRSGSLQTHFRKSCHLNQLLVSSRRTPLETIRAHAPPSTPEKDLRNLLGRLGFAGHRHHHELNTLSGGERVRLVLGSWSLGEPPDLIILDEPENSLDLETLELLESYLQAAPATLLVISHDRSFVERLQISKVISLSAFDAPREQNRARRRR